MYDVVIILYLALLIYLLDLKDRSFNELLTTVSRLTARKLFKQIYLNLVDFRILVTGNHLEFLVVNVSSRDVWWSYVSLEYYSSRCLVNILENIPRGLSKANWYFQNEISQASTGTCTRYYILIIQALADRVHSAYLQKSMWLGHIDQLLYVLYVSTAQLNFVPWVLAASNTVLMMFEISSTLSKENDSKKKLHITQQQEKELYQHLTYLLWEKQLVKKSYYLYIQ